MKYFLTISFLIGLKISYALAFDIESIIPKAGEAFKLGKFEEAIEILEPAVDANHPFATYLTGIVYFTMTPKGSPATKALEYFERSASLGHTAAYLDIGFAYQQGSGVDQNFEKARESFLLAYDGNDIKAKPLAAYAIGGLHLNGFGVEKNETLAKEWYKKSADLGFADAKNILEQLANE